MKRGETKNNEEMDKENFDYLNYDGSGFGIIDHISYTIIINPKAPQLKVSILDKKEIDETKSSE